MIRPGHAWRILVRRVPGTLIYLFVLAITTWMLRSLDTVTTDVFLRSVSTNVAAMSRDAPRVLVLSAFVVQDNGLLSLLAVLGLFVVIHTPTEWWIGTRRWLTIVVTGHIGASIITTLGIFVILRMGHGSRQLVYPVDVGVSYTLAAAAGALVYRFDGWRRPLLAVLAAAVFGVWHLFTGPTFTDVGHTAALAIGLAITPVLMPRHPRRQIPDWQRRTLSTAVGAAALATVALGALALFDAPRQAVADEVPATVVAVHTACASGCPNVELSYTYAGAARTATVSTEHLPRMRVGSSQLIHVHAEQPDAPRLGQRRVSVDRQGILVLSAATAAVVTATLLILRRRMGAADQRLRTSN